jgi:hypothetical protein
MKDICRRIASEEWLFSKSAAPEFIAAILVDLFRDGSGESVSDIAADLSSRAIDIAHRWLDNDHEAALDEYAAEQWLARKEAA